LLILNIPHVGNGALDGRNGALDGRNGALDGRNGAFRAFKPLNCGHETTPTA